MSVKLSAMIREDIALSGFVAFVVEKSQLVSVKSESSWDLVWICRMAHFRCLNGEFQRDAFHA